MRISDWSSDVCSSDLGLYVAFLGTGGGIYGVLRAYGVTVYFGVTYLALLGVLRVLSRQRPRPAVYRGLLLVATGFMAIGLVSVVASYVVTDPGQGDRWSNIPEWPPGLWLTPMFPVLARAWLRRPLRAGLL